MSEPLQFDPHELEEMKRWAALEPGQRIGALLQVQALINVMLRTRLQQEYPQLSQQEISRSVFKIVERRDELGIAALPLAPALIFPAGDGPVTLRTDAAEVYRAAIDAAVAQYSAHERASLC